jgi:hypothetical protein
LLLSSLASAKEEQQVTEQASWLDCRIVVLYSMSPWTISSLILLANKEREDFYMLQAQVSNK